MLHSEDNKVLQTDREKQGSFSGKQKEQRELRRREAPLGVQTWRRAGLFGGGTERGLARGDREEPCRAAGPDTAPKPGRCPWEAKGYGVSPHCPWWPFSWIPESKVGKGGGGGATSTNHQKLCWASEIALAPWPWCGAWAVRASVLPVPPRPPSILTMPTSWQWGAQHFKAGSQRLVGPWATPILMPALLWREAVWEAGSFPVQISPVVAVVTILLLTATRQSSGGPSVLLKKSPHLNLTTR